MYSMNGKRHFCVERLMKKTSIDYLLEAYFIISCLLFKILLLALLFGWGSQFSVFNSFCVTRGLFNARDMGRKF